MDKDKGQILLYQTPDGESRIEVTLQGETVWLSLDQMAELFQRNKSTISRHIKNVFEEGELDKDMVVAKFATTTQHGAIEGKTQSHVVDFYNLDMIISVGYRVHSYRGVQFRMWATRVLKEYIVKGFAFDEMTFADFTKELKKQKIKLTLSQQDEWEDYFNDYTKACHQLSTQIAQTDNEIDNQIFALYDLTDDEREIVMRT